MNRRSLLRLLAGAGGAASLAALWSRRMRGATAPPAAPAYLAELLGPQADAANFARAESTRPFEFPRDHAPHEDYRSEWWYFTGHLATAQGRAFGFQLTLFRFELIRHLALTGSAWRTPRVVLGQFAVSDIAHARFHAFERLSRALPGIAGASVTPPAVWLDDWRVAWTGTADSERFTLLAAQNGIELALELDATSPIVAQGEAGLSRKSATPGNASYYYSIPRLDAAGSLRLPGDAFRVRGTAWLDREWSTSALDRSQTGWDWFALQLDDGSNVMFYRLRERDGKTSLYSAGSQIAADGRVRTLAADAVRIDELAHWRSADSGRRYPSRWRLTIDALALQFELVPRLAAQEWHARFPYWEGAVTVLRQGVPAGLGYVELTGY